MKKGLTVILTMLLLASCGSKKPVIVERKVTETLTETVHDTVFEVKPDSSYYHAFIDCVNGKPVIREPKAEKGKNGLKEPGVNLKDSLLTVECYTMAQQLFAQWKSTHKQQLIETEVPVYVPVEFTWFQKLLLKLGWVFMIIIALVMGYGIYKIIKKVKP